MEEFVSYIVDNKEWLFSGAGITAVSVLGWLFREKLFRTKQTIESGDGSNNVQAGRDVNIDQSGNRTELNLRDNVQQTSSGDSSPVVAGDHNTLIQNFLTPHYTVELVDDKILQEVERIRKSRFFPEFDRVEESLTLGAKVAEGEFSGGSSERRAFALAWCARWLSGSDKTEEAKKFVETAKAHGNTTEAKIAEAFLATAQNKQAVVAGLARIDSNASRSAQFAIIEKYDGAESALKWLRDAEYTASDLDADGKGFLLDRQLQSNLWDEAASTAGQLSEGDFDDSPALHYLVGLTKLMSAVSKELRASVLTYIPIPANSFPFDSGVEGLNARRQAHKHMLDGVDAANRLGQALAAKRYDEYALWLELRDPDQKNRGMERLREKLESSETRLGAVRFAIEFGVDIDVEFVEREIDKEVARKGKVTAEAGIARFAIALGQSTPDKGAEYMSRHRAQLSECIGKEFIGHYQVQMYCHAKLFERANEVVNQLVEQGITKEAEESLRFHIQTGQAEDQVEFKKSRFEETKDIDDLINLVGSLVDHKRWDDLCTYGKRLFDETHDLGYAEVYANALGVTNRPSELVRFLEENNDLISQSDRLGMSYAWALFQIGELIESRDALGRVNSRSTDATQYRQLQINLAITTGDWGSLGTHIRDVYGHKDDHDAVYLLRHAQLALHVRSSDAKHLLFAAVEKASDDPTVLATAYSMASNAGWEDESAVGGWLLRAVELSGEAGPIVRMGVKELLENKPQWEDREIDVWQKLMQGRMPISHAAGSLNQTLVGLISFPALINPSEPDVRRRGTIPAYSGARVQLDSKLDMSSIALDPTAILTLGHLEILELVLESFDTVYIPHSTLAWLFEEHHNASFHQPSRVADAKQIQSLLARGALDVLTVPNEINNELLALVGYDLAAMIGEAERSMRDGDTQHAVVRSRPVHVVSSFLEEEADLSAHSQVLSSCAAIVTKLKAMAELTAEEEAEALSYLRLNENAWEGQPDIADGATLYLDNLSVSYFQHLGLLDKLSAAGFRTLIPRSEVDQANTLVSYDDSSAQVKLMIERTRSTLNRGIEEGQVRVGPGHDYNEVGGWLSATHLTSELLALAPLCEAVVVDDRFFNQRGGVEHDGVQTAIYSTLDLIDSLAETDRLSKSQLWELRTKLRRSGYIIVPVDEQEIKKFIDESEVIDGRLAESAELKAIRESILQVRVRDWLQISQEALWLEKMFGAFDAALKWLWVEGGDVEELKVRSDWIVEQMDIRGWAHVFPDEGEEGFAEVRHIQQIYMLLLPPEHATDEMRSAYHEWIDNRVLAPIQELFPALYEKLAERYEDFLSRIAEAPLKEQGRRMGSLPSNSALVLHVVLRFVPRRILDTLMAKQSFRKKHDFESALLVVLEDNVRFPRVELLNAIRAALAGEADVQVASEDGKQWVVGCEMSEDSIPELALTAGEARIELNDYSMLSSDSSVRIDFLDRLSQAANTLPQVKEKWRKTLLNGPLGDDEVEAFVPEMLDTPANAESILVKVLSTGKASVAALVPNSLHYYEGLVGTYDGSQSIHEYAKKEARKLFERNAEWHSYRGFLFNLLLSSHSALTTEINADGLSMDETKRALKFLEEHGDILSCVGAVEVGLQTLADKPELEQPLLRLIQKLTSDDGSSARSEIRLFLALFMLVDGELARLRLMADKPPFYRRLAALAHAALIHRHMGRDDEGYQTLLDWMSAQRGIDHYMQSLVDMRTEPRWEPFHTSGLLQRVVFLGRIAVAGENNKAKLRKGPLRDVVVGDGSQSLTGSFKHHVKVLPGPLDGVAKRDVPSMPDYVSKAIRKELEADSIELSALNAFVNSVMRFQITSDLLSLAVDALKRTKPLSRSLLDNDPLIGVLVSLAIAAAVTRSASLAEEVCLIAIRSWRDPQNGMTLDVAVNICLAASAAHEDLDDWVQYVGRWFVDLAFDKLTDNEAAMLHSQLATLMHAVPDLWVSCAKADAALKALWPR